MNPATRKIQKGTLLASGLWLILAVIGMGLAAKKAMTPDAKASAPSHWPRESRIALDQNKATLILFAHPHCPCTRSSLGELDRLLAQAPGLVRANVVFIQPTGTDRAWLDTDILRLAQKIPGVTVHFDVDGIEARRFHAETSGHTLVYGPDQGLLFEGGITLFRGHSGDNPGRSAILALLRHQRSGTLTNSVFGCALFDSSTSFRGSPCKK